MSMLAQVGMEQAGFRQDRQGINLPVLLIVVLLHLMLLVSGYFAGAGNGRASAQNTASLQVSLLPGMPKLSPSVPVSAASDEVSSSTPQPVSHKASPAVRASVATGVPTYHPASALSQMPEIEGMFEVPVPPGLGLSGQVELRLWIDAAGTLDRIAVLSGSVPPSYQQAAVAAFKRMHYLPGRIDGQPVAAFVDIVVQMDDALSAQSAPVSLP